MTLAWLYCRDGAQRYSFGVGQLSSDEARRIGKAIARIPEFLMPRLGLYPRGSAVAHRPPVSFRPGGSLYPRALG
ncbi:hypothetical protein [Bradyrhizobium sp. th.b2]|uniref:hypothetical protein n=1 Tax=Bradyrhizobium sp. th-b2 TaxID=172088 RepID=UPI000429E8FE|nr:hypothetical protein [Bradyrhizobium sp. th.b2]